MNARFRTHHADWESTKARFTAWWNRSSLGRPLISASVPRAQRLAPLLPVPRREDMPFDRRYLDIEANIAWLLNWLNGNRLVAEGLACLNLNLGPGSLALYLGSEPVFRPDTVWFGEAVRDWATHPRLRYDPDNVWWTRHLGMIRRAVALSRGEFLVCIPDLIESVDILAALRGPQAFCYDLVDVPDLVHERLAQLDDLYFTYYDQMYDAAKTPDGGVAYTAFHIWGPGKTAKVQCDFAALMSPRQFDEFMVPSLAKQCAALDYSLYHLDGVDAIKHLDALMAIKDLDALQWTAGAGKPDNASECWDHIHDRVKKAGKSLWIATQHPSFEALLATGDRLVSRYGVEGLYLLLSWKGATEEQGLRLMDHAEKHWRR